MWGFNGLGSNPRPADGSAGGRGPQSSQGSVGTGDSSGNKSSRNFCCVSPDWLALFLLAPFSFCFSLPQFSTGPAGGEGWGLARTGEGIFPFSLSPWSRSGAQAALGLGQACFPRARWDRRCGGWRGLVWEEAGSSVASLGSLVSLQKEPELASWPRCRCPQRAASAGQSLIWG